METLILFSDKLISYPPKTAVLRSKRTLLFVTKSTVFFPTAVLEAPKWRDELIVLRSHLNNLFSVCRFVGPYGGWRCDGGRRIMKLAAIFGALVVKGRRCAGGFLPHMALAGGVGRGGGEAFGVAAFPRGVCTCSRCDRGSRGCACSRGWSLTPPRSQLCDPRHAVACGRPLSKLLLPV